MSHLSKWYPGVRRPLFAAIGLALAALLAGPARSGELDKIDGSLKLIPANAAFYSTCLRNREQLEAVLNSKAWAKLKALPAVQLLEKKIQEELGKPRGPLEQFRAFAELKENKELFALLGDMFADEFFIYGGDSWGDFISLARQLYGSFYYRALMMQLPGAGRGLREEDLMISALLTFLSENTERIKAPDLIIGFKVGKADKADSQLKRLETLINGLAAKNPLLQQSFKKVKIAGKDFLTLTADGAMAPWEMIPFKKYEQQPGDFDKLIKKLKTLKVSVSLGVRDQYLLLALGSSNDVVTVLGQGPRLTERDELKPLAKFADKRLTDINYTSKAFLAAVSTSKKDIQGLAAMAKEALQKAKLADGLHKRIARDIDELAKDIEAYIPEVGASLSFSFLTSRGQESYSYDWGEQLSADGAKPLTLLQHVGGSPLLADVSRSKYSPASYQKLVKWLKKANGYFEDFAVPRMSENEKEQYEKFTKIAYPLLKRLDDATGQKLLPSLSEGQTALVFDAKLSSKQWFQGMPPSDKPLPMPELALVMGVNDAKLLKEAVAEYVSVINDTLAVANNFTGGFFPELKVPPPKTRALKDGTLYYYDLPEVGLDKRILPNAGLSDKVVVLSFSLEHSERLLTKTPLKSEGPLADATRPLASAVHFDFAGLIDAFTPWVDYAAGLYLADSKVRLEDKKTAKDILDQVRTVLEVLKVIRTCTSVSYFEGKALVTHSETVIVDLK